MAGETGRIATGCFTSVVVHQDQVYAADYIHSRTRVFQFKSEDSLKWHQNTCIEHEFGSNKHFLTLAISDNRLVCRSYKKGTIKLYSLDGELLQTYGPRCHIDGLFLRDDDGSVLIADCGNDRLQVMSEWGGFSFLQLTPRVSRPCSAVLFNYRLYVTSDNDNAIYQYSCVFSRLFRSVVI